MRLRCRPLLLLALLAGGATGCGAGGGGGDEPINFRDYGACDGTTDDTANLTTALAAAAGKTLYIDSDCKILVSGPAAGACKFTVPTRTEIRGGGHSARIVLARSYCVGGSTPGAYCDGTVTCPTGTCGGDIGATQFAPTAASNYTLLCGAAGATQIQLRDLAIDVRQVEHEWGRCRGGSNDGTACNDGGGVDCLGGGNCWGTGYSPAGPGNTYPIDLSAATASVIDNVDVYGQRNGRSFTIGDTSTIRFSSNDQHGTTADPDIILVPAASATVERGLTMGANSWADHNQLKAGLTGGVAVYVNGASSTVTDSTITGPAGATSKALQLQGGYGMASSNRITGGADSQTVYIGGSDVNVVGNRLAAGSGASYNIYCNGNYAAVTGNNMNGSSNGTNLFVDDARQLRVVGNGIFSSFTGVHIGTDAGNTTVQANRFVFGAGPKVILQSSGAAVVGNYMGWGTGGGASGRAVVEVGDAYSAQGNTTAHPMINGNIIHSEQADTAGIRIANIGKRCQTRIAAAPDHYQTCAVAGDCACTVPGDCPGGTCSGGFCSGGTACGSALNHNLVGISNNLIIVGANPGIDLSGLTNDTLLTDSTVIGNTFGSATGISYPATTLTSITGFSVLGNIFTSSTTNAIVGVRRESYGFFAGNGLLQVDDDGAVFKAEMDITDGAPPAVTTLQSFTLAASRTYQITSDVTARRYGGTQGTAEDGAAYRIIGTYKMVGGVATAIAGSPDVVAAAEDQVAFDATQDVTGATVRVRVVGAANNNVHWHVTSTITSSGS